MRPAALRSVVLIRRTGAGRLGVIGLAAQALHDGREPVAEEPRHAERSGTVAFTIIVSVAGSLPQMAHADYGEHGGVVCPRALDRQ